MLQHLMCVNDVERLIAESEVVHVADTEFDVGDVSRAIASRLVDDRFGAVDSNHTAGCNVASKINRERPGATSDIEKRGAGGKASTDVRGGVVDGAPSM